MYDWHLLEYFSLLLSVLVDKRMPEQCVTQQNYIENILETDTYV